MKIDDSISLIIEGCCAFTGDLPEYSLVEAFNDKTIMDYWEIIRDHKVEVIYPVHGASYKII